MSPAFSHDFLKRLSAFSKLSSGSTITLVTRDSPLSAIPEAPSVYHAPREAATRRPIRAHLRHLAKTLGAPSAAGSTYRSTPHLRNRPSPRLATAQAVVQLERRGAASHLDPS